MSARIVWAALPLRKVFAKSGAFGLSTVAAGLVIGPALSWVDCRPSYLFSTGDVLDTVYKPPDGVGWFIVVGQMAMDAISFLKPIGFYKVHLLHVFAQVAPFPEFVILVVHLFPSL